MSTNTKASKVELTDTAWRNFQRLCEQYGMTQKVVVERTVVWLIEQDPMIQLFVLGRLPEDYENDILNLMKRRRRQAKAVTQVRQAAEATRTRRQRQPTDKGARDRVVPP